MHKSLSPEDRSSEASPLRVAVELTLNTALVKCLARLETNDGTERARDAQGWLLHDLRWAALVEGAQPPAEPESPWPRDGT